MNFRVLTKQSTLGEQYGGTSGQHYVFETLHGMDNAGAGLSVGVNGISVYEHGSDYMSARAVYEGSIGTGWNHVIIVYENKQPFIYLNSVMVREGLTSQRNAVYPPHEIGGGQYGYFEGVIDDVVYIIEH